MASGHVNRTNRPNTWLHRPTCDVKKVLANSEPSTHGTKRRFAWSMKCLHLAEAAVEPPAGLVSVWLSRNMRR
jgi:hypothetical protein